MIWVVLDREDPLYGAICVEAKSKSQALDLGFEQWYGDTEDSELKDT